MSKKVIVVGGGLGGLVCAKRLVQAGITVTVLEKEDRVGGRLKTNLVDGFLIDRGFQVMFTSYPYLKREVDMRALDVRTFLAGSRIVWNGRMREVWRDKPVRMALSTFLEFTDKIRIKGYSSMLKSLSPQQIWAGEKRSALEELEINGLSGPFVEKFARPFFGGVFLDRSLEISQNPFRYVWKMLTEGETGFPSKGMEEIPKQMAEALPEGSIRVGVEVSNLIRQDGAVVGVNLRDGSQILADAVILATDRSASDVLVSGTDTAEKIGCVTLAFASSTAPYDDSMLVLNGKSEGPINHLAVVSNLSPGLAPQGQHLISATVLGIPDISDEDLAQAVRVQADRWFPGMNGLNWRLLRVDRIPFAQYAQPPGFENDLPSPRSAEPGLYLSGEQTTYSSIDGACLAGAQTAALVIEDLTSS